MGHYSKFSLEIDGHKIYREKIILGFLNENPEAEAALNIDGTSRAWAKWYSANKDMIELSLKYPRNVFILGRSEDVLGDIVRIHYQNGEMLYYESGVISYPEFKASKLQDCQRTSDNFVLEKSYRLTLNTEDNQNFYKMLKNVYEEHTFYLKRMDGDCKIEIVEWPSYESDIVDFSKNHPKNLFFITYDVDIEVNKKFKNENDLSGFWIKYIQNGKIYQANAFWDWAYN
jgi:hypothetical protein